MKITRLAKFLECSPKALLKQDYDLYGLNIYSLGAQEYAIGTDEEVDTSCTDNIRDSVWAFNPSFIIDHSKLDWQAEEFLAEFQKNKCENANDSILAVIEDFDAFVNDAISVDGRGHFLSSYDGEEYEQDGYFIYRIN